MANGKLLPSTPELATRCSASPEGGSICVLSKTQLENINMLGNINEKVNSIDDRLDALTSYEGPLATTNKELAAVAAKVDTVWASDRRAHKRVDKVETAFKKDHDNLTSLIVRVSMSTAGVFAVLTFVLTIFFK